MLGWLVLQKLTWEVWTSTDENIADDPTRLKPLRPPVPSENPAVRRLICPERWPSDISKNRFVGGRLPVLEVFAGCGRLSQEFAGRGFPVLPPMDAFPKKGACVPEHDLLEDSVFGHLKDVLSAGSIDYVHFGVPCTGWSQWQLINPNSTRSHARPEGQCPSDSEAAAKELVSRVCVLCKLQARAGGSWSIEKSPNIHVVEVSANRAARGPKY